MRRGFAPAGFQAFLKAVMTISLGVAVAWVVLLGLQLRESANLPASSGRAAAGSGFTVASYAPNVGTRPSGIAFASAAYDRARRSTVLFGGRDAAGNFLSQTWIWNGRSWTQATTALSPPARAAAAIAYDARNRQVVLFGGQDNDLSDCPHLRDTWTWDGRTWTARNVALAPDLCEAGAAYDASAERVILFGFKNGGRIETWSWNGQAWALLHPLKQPSARHGASMSQDSASQSIVLFGGFNESSGLLNDTWLWKDGAWTEQKPAISPSPREGSVISDLGGSRGALLVGGLARGRLLSDSWRWDGSAWSALKPETATPARAYGTATYDPLSGGVLVFGGIGQRNDPSRPVKETWIWTISN